ncbi:Coronin-7 [Haplosporangium sp. Z 767]|nr:Coronin-7 [Haplosporangium sp. Z 767]
MSKRLFANFSKYRNAVGKAAKHEDFGRAGDKVHLLNAHAAGVADWEFSPFDANMLLTGSENGEIKAWQIVDENGLITTRLLCTIATGTGKPVETIVHHPTATGIGQGHTGNRPSRVVWLGERDLLFTVGFNKMREREYALWNSSDLAKPMELKRMDSSSALTVPLYDEDTSIVFIPSRGESTIRWIELADSSPFMSEGVPFAAQGLVAGASLMPKQILNVMQTEIDRILTVNTNGLWPISVNVPRRTYLDFHADLYPDTKSTVPGLDASEWLQGEDRPVPRESLDPGMAGKPNWIRQSVSHSTPAPLSPGTQIGTEAGTKGDAGAKARVEAGAEAEVRAKEPLGNRALEPAVDVSPKAVPVQAKSTISAISTPKEGTKKAMAPSSAAMKIATQKTSKFRFLTFKSYHSSEHFENISGLSISTTPECSLIEVNPKFMALPLHGSGGRIAILKTTEPGRVGAKMPSLVCSSDLLGFKFDPFDPHLLVTASNDAKIKGWIIPHDGLNKENDVTKPDWILEAPTMDKISLIMFHPKARNVLLSASADRSDPTLRLWDLKSQKEMVAIKGHKDVIFSCDFNHTGTKIVSVCRDKIVRVWDALTGELLQQGPNHDSVRSCRVLWLGESDMIASVGFGRGSQREILLYDANDLEGGPIDRKQMDNSPGVLVPHYDPDTSILGVSARGDRVMKHFEILRGTREDAVAGKNLIVDIASLEQGSLQQDVAYLPKRYCNIKEVELAKMYRLTYNSVEVISVSVPRNKKEFFQDDLFPDTVDVEAATMEAGEFFAGAADVPSKRIHLCPPDMEPLSHHLAMTASTPQQGGSSLDKFLQGKQQVAEDEKKRLAMERMFETAKESKADRDTLVPDTGVVDDDEWDD